MELGRNQRFRYGFMVAIGVPTIMPPNRAAIFAMASLPEYMVALCNQLDANAWVNIPRVV
jgi:hypothetical protein